MGPRRAELLAIRPGGAGDVTDSHVAWKAFGGIGHKPSPLMVDGLLYTVADSGGVVACFDALDGTRVWQGRVGGEAHSAPPLYAAGRIHAFAEDGTAAVLEPGRELRVLGRGRLGEAA